MKSKILFIAVSLLVAFVASCSSDAPESKDYLLKVNDYTMTEADFSALLKQELEVDRGFDITGDTRAAFLDDLIRKQLLIQAAREMNLDREENFRQSIQRYWEATLIRELLNTKGKQLRKETAVTPEEIEHYYTENRANFADQNLEDLQQEISQLLENQHVNTKLKEWIDSLVTQAEVKVNDAALAAKMVQVREANE